MANYYPYIAAAHAEFIKETNINIDSDVYEKAFMSEIPESEKFYLRDKSRLNPQAVVAINKKRLITYAKENNYTLESVSLNNLVNIKLSYLIINLAVNATKQEKTKWDMI